MAENLYTTILKDLEGYFKCTLQPDQNNSCLIELPTGIKIQVEQTRYEDLLMAVRLGVIPASKYRELVFKECLKSNFLNPVGGVFGYSGKSNTLYFFVIIDKRNTGLENLTNILNPFLEKAQKWEEEVRNGRVPQGAEEVNKGPSIFGLR